MSAALLAAGTLWQRELTRFYRERARVIGALLPPVVFWFLIGSGLGDSFAAGPGAGYLQFFFAGTLQLIVLFTSVFSTISLIEDRREGFLQGVLVAPIPRLSLVLGKVLGAATVGLAQGLLFLAFAGPAGLSPGAEGYLLAAAALALSSIGLTGLGFCIAWSLDSTQGFHAVMNLFLIPMWMLSGALFPAAGAPAWLKLVMALNPVGYGVAALQRALLPAHAAASGAPPLPLCFAVLAAFAVLSLAASAALASRRDSR